MNKNKGRIWKQKVNDIKSGDTDNRQYNGTLTAKD